MNNKAKAFTLIELLVVLAIVTVLALVFTVALNPFKRIQESRDSKRQADLQSVRSALDIALTDGTITLTGTELSPTTGNSKTDTRVADGTGWVKYTLIAESGLAEQISILPEDPLGNSAPCNGYEFSSDGTYYELKTCFETTKYQGYYTTDGGNNADRWELGSKPGLTL
ncbi:type II secretion system protein [bacterium]|nr:type II secretion system protein [bacterium]